MNFGGRKSQLKTNEAPPHLTSMPAPRYADYPVTSFSARGARRMEEWKRAREMGGAPIGPDGNWIAVPSLNNPSNNIAGAGVGARGKVELKQLLSPRYDIYHDAGGRLKQNPIVATHEEQMQAIQDSIGFKKIPELVFNPTTMQPASWGDRSPRAMKEASLRTQPWSMYTNHNATGGSTKGYGKGGVRPPAQSSWGLVSGDANQPDPVLQPQRPLVPRVPKYRSTAMSIALGVQPNDNYGNRRMRMSAACSPRDRNNGGVNPITGKAYDENVEAQRIDAQRQALKDFHERHNYSAKLSSAAKDLLSPRPENGLPWLPPTKRTVGLPKTSIVPDELRTSDLPNTSKMVYKQQNAQSQFRPWKPSRKCEARPADKAVASLLGRGEQVYLPLTGPNDGWKPKQDAQALPGNLYNGPNGPRF